ncbi:DUF3667 domain-containing protein [Gramella sp. AN32]|uniref:DUF3667 domain-containing protein n=1 Tax=Christiangramia antarctica TaxID=2058158 RepID=A0ABW5X883_9FLAO|nr:DUF3667 domain-containing protein [Gramella sp. AN32]MCM4154804.1 hypothetical protein [Gramella sp. AN32]
MEKERSLAKYRGEKCLNCGHPLDKSDRFCPNCSQLNSYKKLSFKDFFNEFFSGLFAYDSRLNNTLFTILFKPGKIAKEYIEGKRVKYVNPFRFLLSIAIIFFLIFGTFNEWNFSDSVSPRESMKNLTPEEKAEIEQELKQVKVPFSFNMDSSGDEAIKTDKKTYLDDYETDEKLNSYGFFEEIGKRTNLYTEFNSDTDIVLPKIALDSLHHPQTAYNNYLYEKSVNFNEIKKNPRSFVNYMLQKMPLFIFFFLPVLALFFWLLYMRKPYTYMEHLVFTFYTQSVYLILTGVAVLLGAIFENFSFIGLFNLVFLFYLYKSLRRFYGQGRVKTILKFLCLNVIFFTLAFIGFIISLFFTVALY